MTHGIEQQNRQALDERNRFETRLAALEQTADQDRRQGRADDARRQGSAVDAGGAAAGVRASATTAGVSTASFIQRFPAGPAGVRRRTWRSACRSCRRAKYPNAAAEFQKVLTAYPAAPEVPEAMWQLARAFVQLHFCTDARSLLNDLVKRYPKSPRAADAKAELKTIAKLPKSSCTS